MVAAAIVCAILLSVSTSHEEMNWRFVGFKTNKSGAFAVVEGNIPSSGYSIGMNRIERRGTNGWEPVPDAGFVLSPEPPHRIGLGLLPPTGEAVRIRWNFQKMSLKDRLTNWRRKLSGKKGNVYTGAVIYFTNEIPAHPATAPPAPRPRNVPPTARVKHEQDMAAALKE